MPARTPGPQFYRLCLAMIPGSKNRSRLSRSASAAAERTRSDAAEEAESVGAS